MPTENGSLSDGARTWLEKHDDKLDDINATVARLDERIKNHVGLEGHAGLESKMKDITERITTIEALRKQEDSQRNRGLTIAVIIATLLSGGVASLIALLI